MNARGPEIVVVVNPTKVDLAEVREVLQDAATASDETAPETVLVGERDSGPPEPSPAAVSAGR
ncbi:hypothetical protein [Kribbella soli]|uniref:Uncharacterized protein n=1 Tax=Kribbella soli TaxID=1124743 RepID=A0A4R0HN49_9ACTN|nr:hypothetical protein [Kribbella soli]TCC11380.1 hypothetical protein E0H45_08900 [Kribbella soli]